MASKAAARKTCGSPDCLLEIRQRTARMNGKHAAAPDSIAKSVAARTKDWREFSCACGCGETFSLPPYRYNRSKTGRFFVNAEHARRFLRKENHPCWRGGGFNYEHGWREIAKRVRARDKVCQKCGKTPEDNGRALDVHHIVPFRIAGEHNMSNLIALCSACHGAEQTAEQVVYPTAYTTKCVTCGVVFEPNPPTVRVCSDACAKARQARFDRESRQRARDENRPSAQRRREYQRIKQGEYRANHRNGTSRSSPRSND